MNTRIAAIVAAAALACGHAMAADPGKDEARDVYRQEQAECVSGSSNQSQADCMKEARNAAADAKKGQLDSGRNLDANATARCDALPDPDKADCLARMTSGTTIGNPKDGGVLREKREVIIGEPKP